MHAFQHEEIESSNAFKAEEAQKRAATEAGRWHNVLASKVSQLSHTQRSAPLCICDCTCMFQARALCLSVCVPIVPGYWLFRMWVVWLYSFMTRYR